jgi:hypothetical protein
VDQKELSLAKSLKEVIVMRMKYEKPMVAVDRYALSQAIAGCSIKVGLSDRGCFLTHDDVTPQMKGYAYYGWFVDTTGTNPCSIHVEAGHTYTTDSGDGFCYHTNVNGALTS